MFGLGISITPRGGGTSMAGNAIGTSLVLDLSRRMAAVEKPDAGEAAVWVDAGVVLGELRSYIESVTAGMLTFAPDPSSMTRATVGGSIGNDACGNHSVAYGRMTQHVEEVELVTADGAYLRAGRNFLSAVDHRDGHSVARAAELLHGLKGLAQANLAALRVELGNIPRQVSGYHLGHLLPENGLDVAAAMAGSEGTCAIVVRAKVRPGSQAAHNSAAVPRLCEHHRFRPRRDDHPRRQAKRHRRPGRVNCGHYAPQAWCRQR